MAATTTQNIVEEFDALLDTLNLSLKNPPNQRYHHPPAEIRTLPPSEVQALPPRMTVNPASPNTLKKSPPPVAAKPKKLQRITTTATAVPSGNVYVDVTDGSVTSRITASSPGSPRGTPERSSTGNNKDVGFDLPPPPVDFLEDDSGDFPPPPPAVEVLEKPEIPPPFDAKNNNDNNNKNNESNKNDKNNENNNNDKNNRSDVAAQIFAKNPNPNSFGICGKCGEDVPRQGEGCTTVGSEVYHKDCFKCAECDVRLEGIVYYNPSTGKPNCQQCNDQTLHRCQACSGIIKVWLALVQSFSLILAFLKNTRCDDLVS